MILPDSLNSVKTVLIGTNQGAQWMNTLYFHTDTGALDHTPAGTAALFTFNTAIAASWTSSIAPLCNTSVFLTAVSSIDLTNRTAPVAYSTEPTPIPGTAGAANLPVSIAMAMSWRVSNRYRGGHGRIYVPAGLQANITTGRLWSSAFQASAISAAQAFHASIDGLSIGGIQVNHVVLSYFSGSHKTVDDPHPAPVLRPEPLVMPITAATVHGRVDTQRRRLGKEVV